jgi:two-component system CheB/CheR fusion protein
LHDEHGYRVRKEIREAVAFAPHNVIVDAPFTKLDLLSCRNLLIYLSPELQKKLIALFHCALHPGGILFLGTAETIGTYSHLFTPVDAEMRLFRQLRAAVGAPGVESSSAVGAPTAPGRARRTTASPRDTRFAPR